MLQFMFDDMEEGRSDRCGEILIPPRGKLRYEIRPIQVLIGEAREEPGDLLLNRRVVPSKVVERHFVRTLERCKRFAVQR